MENAFSASEVFEVSLFSFAFIACHRFFIINKTIADTSLAFLSQMQ